MTRTPNPTGAAPVAPPGEPLFVRPAHGAIGARPFSDIERDVYDFVAGRTRRAPSGHEIAAEIGISEATVRRVLGRLRKCGAVRAPRKTEAA